MLERLLSFWKGKLFVLALLGFAATDFVITMTLSAADASRAPRREPHPRAVAVGPRAASSPWGCSPCWVAVFLRGFTEAIGLAVGLVATYLLLNVVVIGVALWHVVRQPSVVPDWTAALTTQHGSPVMMVAVALLVFPKLALGLSGFETGVAVMPHVRGDASDTERRPSAGSAAPGRLLTSAAVIMSVFLVTSSFVDDAADPGRGVRAGRRRERSRAGLPRARVPGSHFGAVYDASTIAILWFAGASAMAGLLNLIPRYLPRYGMAPEWAGAVRPLVLVLTGTAFLITWIFDADVDAQGGAYATGVLVLITSAAVAVTLAARRARQRWATSAFAMVSAVFVYTTAANVVERPDGVKIGGCFILAIVGASLASRLRRVARAPDERGGARRPQPGVRP